MKKHILTLLAFLMATMGFAQTEPSVEMTMDTLSGCAPLTVHFTFKSIANTDTLVLMTGDGQSYQFADMTELSTPIQHIYKLYGRYIPAVRLIQWVTSKDSAGNDQRVRLLKTIASPDTLSITDCRGGCGVFKDSCEWSVSCHKYRTCGETSYDGFTYLKVYKDEFWKPETGTGRTFLYALIRYDDENKRLYGIPSSLVNPPMSSFLMYDFSLQVGDSAIITSLDRGHNLVAKCVGRDSITLHNGEKRATLRIQIFNPNDQWDETDGFDETIWIEGIGSNYGLFSPDYKPKYGCLFEKLRLLCYHEQDELLLDFPEFDTDSTPGDCYNNDIEMRVPHITAAQSLSLYPNPSKHSLYITNGERYENTSYEITDVTGRMVLQGSYNATEGIRVSGLAKGLYLLRMEGQYGRFVKE